MGRFLLVVPRCGGLCLGDGGPRFFSEPKFPRESCRAEGARFNLVARPQPNSHGDGSSVIERHFTINELSDLLQMSFERTRQLVKDEPGVLRFTPERKGDR